MKLNLLSVTTFLSLISCQFLYSEFIAADFIILNFFEDIFKVLMGASFRSKPISEK